ncbi:MULTISPECIES: hypothetical protein [Gynuella]|uniref:Uncharacterized protein n=1 Tax=Gynuella sunshinyii YC6258 TaxID=1445510 RepID=A0A0C5VEG5_9GAMM|nr:hypothetical protein [Gynuella sunshinyii]AJQ92606.1 hypothetical Protein YC6258_00556 [Gynuella sunshinyii YC6258]
MRINWPIFLIMFVVTLLLSLVIGWLIALTTSLWILGLIVLLTHLAMKFRTDQ